MRIWGAAKGLLEASVGTQVLKAPSAGWGTLSQASPEASLPPSPPLPLPDIPFETHILAIVDLQPLRTEWRRQGGHPVGIWTPNRVEELQVRKGGGGAEGGSDQGSGRGQQITPTYIPQMISVPR